MPMPYGERQRVFYRLREEVTRKYNDLSIFAWTGPATTTLSLPRRPASSRTTAKSVARHTPATSTSAAVSTPNSRSQTKASSSLRLSSTRSINCPFPPTNTSSTSANTTAPIPTTTPSPTSVACYSKKSARASLCASKKRPTARPPSEDGPPSIPAGSQLHLLYPSNA
ncbi:uncharacterized protein G6M90_00g020130 [Metarhizium brunneum]|uniref:DUF8212 domain-containing protein n=1 Tax=Metarhizium brunneum TaxID=500148 RepID=A0A7D5YTI6_9HYPO|nr:hypothetical protein G6M90_00g020130 [Metarhizium brunneum]